jgi:HAMP domain-containing protein
MAGASAEPGRKGAGFSLRLHIFLAFVLLSAITLGLGVFAARSVGHSGGTVAAIFDRALIATSYTRSAAAGFAAMDAAFARRRLAADAPARQTEEDRIAELAAAMAEDLKIVADRATSEGVFRAVTNAHAAALAWLGVARTAYSEASPDWERLSSFAAEANERFEVLVNHVAGDAFRQRQEARAAVAAARRRTVAGTLAALLLGAAVAALLARRVVGPVAAASRAASRIAAGRLDTPIPAGGRDELGTLLAAMVRMRDAIRATIEREKAERRDAQARLADAMEGSAEGIVLTDAAGRITAVNLRAAELLPPGVALGPGATWARVAAALDTPDAETVAALRRAPPAAAEFELGDGTWLRVSRSSARGGGAAGRSPSCPTSPNARRTRRRSPKATGVSTPRSATWRKAFAWWTPRRASSWSTAASPRCSACLPPAPSRASAPARRGGPCSRRAATPRTSSPSSRRTNGPWRRTRGPFPSSGKGRAGPRWRFPTSRCRAGAGSRPTPT